MSSTPRTWQRSRLGTPLGRARVRQPFRSPLLSRAADSPDSAADSPGSAAECSRSAAGASASTPISAGTRTPSGLRVAAQPFRSPLLTSEKDVPTTMACGQDHTSTPKITDPLRSQQHQDRSPTETSPQISAQPLHLAASGASPVLRDCAIVSPPTGPEPAVVSPPADCGAHSDRRAVNRESSGAGIETETAVSFESSDSELVAAQAAADEELSRLEAAGCRAEQLPLFIAALHEYNEVKDAAQLVMGRIAELDGVTVRAVHQRYSSLPPTEQS